MKISGIVIRGKGKGKRLGFPTVNLELKEKIESGVYAGKIIVNNQEYKAGIFISPDKKMLEAYLIGFSGDLYDKVIEAEIGKKIRDVIKFENDEELIKQIRKDLFMICNS